MTGYAPFTRPLPLIFFVFRGEMVTKLHFKTMTETVWHACWEQPGKYEHSVYRHPQTSPQHVQFRGSGHHTQTLLTFTSLRVWRPNFLVRHLILNIFHPDRDTPRAVHTLGTSAASGMDHELTAVTPGLHAHTHVWRLRALGRVLWWDQTVIGLVGSQQANWHLAAGAVVRLRPAGNTTADQRKVYLTVTHASNFVRMCTKQNFQRDVRLRSVSSRAPTITNPVSLFITLCWTSFYCHSV